MKKIISFDWDNTLVNTLPITLQALNHTLRHFGKSEWTKEQLKAESHFSVKGAFPSWFGENSDQATEIYKKAYQAFNSQLEFLPNSFELLRILRAQGLRMSLISNKMTENLRAEVEKLGLKHFFEVVIGADDVKKNKPDIEAMQKMCDLMKVLPEEVIYYGDTVVDLEFAEKSGCKGVKYEGNHFALLNAIFLEV